MSKLEAFTLIVLILGVLLILASLILVGQHLRNERAREVELQPIILTLTEPEGYTCVSQHVNDTLVYKCTPWR